MKSISKENIIYEFKPDMKHVEKVKPDNIVKFHANDAFNNQIQSEDTTLEEVDFSKLNPATGPLYVEGAEKGDILKIKILDISIPNEGVVVTAPEAGALGDMVEEPITKIMNIEKGFCIFNDLKIPLKPMIGVIGVAPEKKAYSTGTPWKHGGNMDTKDICEGSILYLPVKQKGGLLALGDCHALMGDGEVCVASCEISSEVIVKVEVIKKGEIEWPIVETEDETMIITSGETADDALKEATRQVVESLSKGRDISWLEAYLLASLVVDLRISQIVDPKKTARAAVPKDVLSTEGIIRNEN